MELKNGVILRDYHIIRQLGIGGMGEVYLAEEALLGRQVAIKRLNPQLTGDPQFSERFINEARIQARLQHQNIVGLYNFFVEEDVYYMVMEYAPGLTLKELIAQTGPIPEQRTLDIFKQIVDALGYAHSKQIIHRDIKPSNILIDHNDKVKVMGGNPHKWKDDNLPVEWVSWFEAVDYCNKRSILEGLKPCYLINKSVFLSFTNQNVSCDWAATGYRLPTEAEWEYAARGGNHSQGCLYSGSNNLYSVAWYAKIPV